MLEKEIDKEYHKHKEKIRFIFYDTPLHYRTIIVSDLHLGAPDSKHKQLLDFLQRHSCDHLILNGDIIDGLYLKFFPKTRNTTLTKVIKNILSSQTPQTKISYIQGNHDHMRYKNIKINRDTIDIVTQIKYESGDKTYLICHGQQFDDRAPKWIEYSGFLVGVFIYRLNRQYNSRRISHGLRYESIVSKIKDLGKIIMTGGTNSIEKKIEKLCRKEKVDGFICGHLHHAKDTYIGNFHYLNSGDRVESMTALAETTDHQWSVVHYE